MRFTYSDMGYILLGDIVERVSGQSLDEFTRDIFSPLGMKETTFQPQGDLKKRAAPTEQCAVVGCRAKCMTRAQSLGGVAGHAGLFSTANDLAVYAKCC